MLLHSNIFTIMEQIEPIFRLVSFFQSNLEFMNEIIRTFRILRFTNIRPNTGPRL